MKKNRGVGGEYVGTLTVENGEDWGFVAVH